MPIFELDEKRGAAQTTTEADIKKAIRRAIHEWVDWLSEHNPVAWASLTPVEVTILKEKTEGAVEKALEGKA